MKQKRKEMWKHMRAIGMIRFTLLLGGSWSGFFIVLTTLTELWPDGKFLSFGNFLGRVVIYLVGGYLFGLLMWVVTERAYQKAINTPERTA